MGKRLFLGNTIIEVSFNNEIENFESFDIFERGNEIENNVNNTKIKIYGVDCLPSIGGSKIWGNEICKVYLIGEHEVRYYIDALTQEPYALFIEKHNKEYQLFIMKKWITVSKNRTYFYNPLSLEKILIENRQIIFHTCYIRYRDEAILFTGFSGVGKSTQGNLWETYNSAEVINGDRCILGKEKDFWYAYGVPFSGTSNICKNVTSKIRAIVYLQQNTEDQIDKLSPMNAVKLLWEQITVNHWNREFVEKAWDVLAQLCMEIPVYYLRCTKEISAVECLSHALYQEED